MFVISAFYMAFYMDDNNGLQGVLFRVNWKNKFQLSHTSDWNLLLQGYGVELTSPNIPAWY